MCRCPAGVAWLTVTGSEPIVRTAARGEGVTADGRHVADTAPGDRVGADGKVERGSHHVEPPCRHFPRCGGCQLQHVDDEALRAFVRDRVVTAAHKKGVRIGEVLDVHLSPPRSRRRATLHAGAAKRRLALGFREERSHRIVDMRECHVLDPALFALVEPLRTLIAQLGAKGGADIALTLCDRGVDVGIANLALEGLQAREAALAFAREHDLARLSVDEGYGPETVWEPQPASVTLSGVGVKLPPGAFLQATPDAERRMVADACEWLGKAGAVADLFAGLGTFAFALARSGDASRRVLAVEAERSAHEACRNAADSAVGLMVKAPHRDLFRNPLQGAELDRFDAALLDPPRAGARAQTERIAASALPRLVYVSCNPASWARDAATLCQAGFRLECVRPIGQFRWSTHVELTSLFTRE